MPIIIALTCQLTSGLGTTRLCIGSWCETRDNGVTLRLTVYLIASPPIWTKGHERTTRPTWRLEMRQSSMKSLTYCRAEFTGQRTIAERLTEGRCERTYVSDSPCAARGIPGVAV